jgi:hypothetical protein
VFACGGNTARAGKNQDPSLIARDDNMSFGTTSMFDDKRALAGPVCASYRTSKFTTAPAKTFCPAGGVCATIMLAGDG